MNPTATSVEEYISWFPQEIRKKLELIRQTIRQAVPEAKEVISYYMPAFKTKEVLVYYAAAKKYIGFYPHSQPIKVFKKELAAYKTSKGAIQIPYDQPIPVKLMADIAKFRFFQVEEKKETKN